MLYKTSNAMNVEESYPGAVVMMYLLLHKS